MNDADEKKLQVIKEHLWECPKPMTCRGLCDECCKRWMVEKIETLDRYFEEACALGASSVNRAEHAERQLEDLRLTEEEDSFLIAVEAGDFEDTECVILDLLKIARRMPVGDR